MTKEEKQQIIERVLRNFLVRGKQYPAPLPADLRDWYCYPVDGGHSILCLLEQETKFEAEDLALFSLPVPVKAVLRGYRIYKEFPVVNLPYDSNIGLITDAEDDEY